MQTRTTLRMQEENNGGGEELIKDFILTRESFYNLTYYNNSISNMFRKWSMCAFVSPPRFYFPFCFSNERIYYNNTGESIFFICNFVVSRHDGILYDSFLFLLFLKNEKVLFKRNKDDDAFEMEFPDYIFSGKYSRFWIQSIFTSLERITNEMNVYRIIKCLYMN